MKELLKLYASYNGWASQQLFNVILALPEEKQLEEVPSSFGTLFKTVVHMWDAESAWWQRMKMQERVIVPGESFKGTIQELISNVLQQSKQWEEWVSNASEMMLEHVFQYQNIKGEQIKMPIYQMVHHVFNHGTYHRGHLVNMLRQLGVEKIPQTDFSFWVRIKK